MNLLTTTALTVFTANTKAKSSEVNTNFSTIKSHLSDFEKDAKHGTIALQSAYTSAGYNFTDNDGIYDLHITTGSTNCTVTLPTAADNIGRIAVIRKHDTGAGVLTLDGENAETVDGVSQIYLPSKGDWAKVKCNTTTGWEIIGLFLSPFTYRHGTNYLGGTGPTITGSTTTVSAVNGSALIPYKSDNGKFRLKFSCRLSLSGNITTGTNNTISISGVTFRNISNFRQAVLAVDNAGTNPMGAYVAPNDNDITVKALTANTDDIILYGDTELESAPTWSYLW